MIFGVGFYSYVIGNMTSLVESNDSDNEEIQEKLETLKKFAKNSKLPATLYNRIKKFIENSALQKKYQESEKLLSDLPKDLREKVVARTHGDVLSKIKFFVNKHHDFQTSIVYDLKPISLGKNELLYQQGDACDNIYFIHTGRVKLFIDVVDYIYDERMLAAIREMEERRKNMMEKLGTN